MHQRDNSASINQASRGLSIASTWTFLGIVLPALAHEFLGRYQQFRGLAFPVGIMSVPIALCAMLVLPRVPWKARIVSVVAKIVASVFLILSGLKFLWFYHVDDWTATLFMGMALVFGLVATGADMQSRELRAVFETTWTERIVVGIAIAGIGIPALLGGTWGVAFIGIALLFSFTGVLNLLESVPEASRGKDVARKMPGNACFGMWGVGFLLFPLAILVAEVFTSTTRGPYSDQLWNFGLFPVAILPAGAGCLVALLLPRRLRWLLPATGMATVASLAVYTSETVLKFEHILDNPWNVIIAAFASGIAVTVAIRAFTVGRDSEHAGKGRSVVLFFAIILGMYIGYMLYWDVIYATSGIPPVVYFVTGPAIALVFMMVGMGIEKALPRSRIPWFTGSASRAPPWISRAARYRGRALLLATVFVPAFLVGTVAVANASVHVTLPVPMYDVDGNLVESLWLAPWHAKVLYHDPIMQDTGGPDTSIRAHKNVRLGGYFYVFGGIADAIDIVGNNMDVWACGAFDSTFSPANITSIRALNPAIRIYYQVFATALMEDPTNPDTETWSGTNYANVRFNDTMLEWTVKGTDGNEIPELSSRWGGSHFMDPANDDWAKYFSRIYKTRVDTFHCDGISIDEISFEEFWGVPFSKIRDYESPDDVTAAAYLWLSRISNYSDYEIISTSWWPEAQQYQNGTWGEIAFFARPGTTFWGPADDDRPRHDWLHPADWFTNVATVEHYATTDRTYIWAAWYTAGNSQQLEYAIGSYLMGISANNTRVVFQPQPIYDYGYGSQGNDAGYALQQLIDEMDANPNLFNIQLGDPIGAMSIKGGPGGRYVQRDFQHGIVLVNPFHPHVLWTH